MKIEYLIGNLLDVGEQIIAHSCNVAGGFGSGVAGAIAARYPEVKRKYMLDYLDKKIKLGDIQDIQAGSEGVHVINLYCQPEFGYDGAKYVSYDAVDTALRKLDAHARTCGLDRIAFPLFGTVRGGGKWEIISAILEVHSNNFKPIVYILPGDKR